MLVGDQNTSGTAPRESANRAERERVCVYVRVFLSLWCWRRESGHYHRSGIEDATRVGVGHVY